jgi:predicted Zn finger-like uncharacterized protein
MAIAMRCPTCGKNYQLLDEQAGMRVRCKECKTAFDVPAKPERLEVIPKLPASRGPRLPEDVEQEDDELPVPPVEKKSRGNRTMIWVASILGLSLVVVAVCCAGGVWWLTMQWKPTIQQIAKMPEPPPPPRPVEQPKPKDVEIQIPEFKVPTVDFKNLDDALEKLRTGNQFTRLSALGYIGKQKPPADPAKKKAVLDALDKAANDKDPLISGAAGYAKIIWESD